MQTIARFMNDELGATAIEYGLIAAIVGVSIILGLGNLRDALNGILAQIAGELNGV